MSNAAEVVGLKIGEIIRKTGVTRATVHHYVREGLLPEPTKLSRNQALYPPNCIDRVLLIKGLQKHQRMSLSEVKKVLRGASDDAGLQRLKAAVEVEADQQRVSILNPDRTRESLSRAQLMARTGFSEEQMAKLEETGFFTAKKVGRKTLYDPVNVDVADALAGLMQAGFDQATGFTADDAAIYLNALTALLHEEVMLFLNRSSSPGANSDGMVKLAEQGIERVTPLILALRRKLIREFIEAAPLGGT